VTTAERYRGQASFLDAIARQDQDPELRIAIFALASAYRSLAKDADRTNLQEDGEDSFDGS